MIPEIIGALSSSPDEFYLLLAIVLSLIPLQTFLGLELHKRSTARSGTASSRSAAPNSTR